MNEFTVAVTDGTFENEVNQAKGLVLVDFWAEWCGPCRMIAPTLDALAKEYAGKAKVAKLDVDSNQGTAMKYNIRSIPAVLFFKDGKHVDTVVGLQPKQEANRQLDRKKNILAAAGLYRHSAAGSPEDLNRCVLRVCSANVFPRATLPQTSNQQPVTLK